MLRFKLILVILLFACINVFGADYYWVGGSGDWSDINHWATTSGGSIKHLQAPTPSDNVFFDANSFSSSGQTINLNAYQISVNDFIVSQADSVVFNKSLCQTFKVYGSLEFQQKMNFPENIPFYFSSFQSGNTIDAPFHTFSSIHFEGNGGSWTLQDNLTTTSTIFLEKGEFNTNGYTVTCFDLQSNVNDTRTLTLGDSKIFLFTLFIQGQNINVNSGKSEFIFKNGITPDSEISNTPTLNFYDFTFEKDSAVITTLNNNIHFHDVKFHKKGNIIGDNTIHNLILYAGNTLHLSPGYTQTILGNINPNSNCVDNTVIKSDSNHAIISKTSGTIDVYDIRLKNVHAQGGAVFNAYRSIDMGNNTGWNFHPAASRTLYWVNGNGNWNDTTNWALTSGGVAGECPPTYVDNVIIDQNSGSNDTINIGKSPYTPECHDITWQKNQSNPNVLNIYSSKFFIHGSMIFDDRVNLRNSSQLIFCSDDMGEIVKTGNAKMSIYESWIMFNGKGGWTIQDSLKAKESPLLFIEGSLNTGGEYISCACFISNKTKPREFTLGNTVMDVWHGTDAFEDTSWLMVQDSLLINPGTSLINFNDTFPLMVNQALPGASFHNVVFKFPDNHTHMINRQTHYNKITFEGNAFMQGEAFTDSLMLTQDHIYEFEHNTVQTVYDHLDAPTGCLGWITMKSKDEKEQASIASPSGTIAVQNVNMKKLNATGGANFYAYNSKDQGGNTGWVFTAPTGADHYWVGGNGNWSDTTHWSYSSGGPGGACLPTPFDNVYFDHNSFNGSFNIVNIDCYNAFCKDMDWSSATGKPVLSGKKDKFLHIFGSLAFNDSMTVNYYGSTAFSARDSGNTIYTGKNTFKNEVFFDGQYGSWRLMDTLFSDSSLYHHSGYLDLNEYGLKVWKYLSEYSINKALDMNYSHIQVNADEYDAFKMHSDSLLSFPVSHSLIEITDIDGGMLNEGADSNSVSYDEVLFKKYGILTTENVETSFQKVTFEEAGEIWGANRYDTLVFYSGDYIIEREDTQTIVHDWQFINDCNHYIKMNSELSGTAANVWKLNGNVSGDYLKIKDIHGLGQAVYNAYESYDKGNTNGWQFHPKTPLNLYWVNGEGNWDDPYHWSFTSGGPGGACIPRKIDDVYFDSLSFMVDTSKTVNIPVSYTYTPPVCHNMDWTGARFIPKLNTSVHIYGSLTFIDSMKNKGALSFLSDSTGETIKMAGQSAPSISFYNEGTWNLEDNMKSKNSIILNNGTLNTHGYTIRAQEFLSDVDTARTLNLYTSKVYLSQKWLVDGTNLSLNAGQSFIRLLDTTTSNPLRMHLKNGNAQQYHNVLFKHKNANSILKMENVEGYFDKLHFDSDTYIQGRSFSDSLIFTSGHTYRLDHTKTQTIYDHWQIRGNNCFPINLESTLKDNQAKVKKDGSDVQGDFINMRDIKAQGNATFYAGNFSDDINNNDNWIFGNGPSYVYGLPDTSYFALGDSTTLKTDNFNGGPSTQYLWSTGSTKDSIVVDSSGWYSVIVTYAGGCTVIDSTYLSCTLDIDFLSKETTCHGGNDGYAKIILPDTSATYTYQWETGDTTVDINNQSAGWINVEVIANQLCAVYDSVEIMEPPPVEVPLDDTVFCEDDSLLLDAGSSFIEYVWNDGYSQQSRWVWNPDTFALSVQDGKGCWSELDTIVVKQDSIPYFNLGQDTTLCLYETKTLEAIQGCDAYLWNTGSTSSDITVDQVGTFYVKVWRGACTYSDTIELSHCQPEIKIPNVFTPNGDGFNDQFAPEATNIFEFEMIIINRWGKEIFRTSDINQGWNGKINGQKASEGTYYYVLRFKKYGGKQHNEQQTLSGIVTLLR